MRNLENHFRQISVESWQKRKSFCPWYWTMQ